MGEKDYVYFLTARQLDRFRYYHYSQRGRIIRFLVQYEAFIDEKWHPIIRYDTAHGRPHKDILHPDGSQEKVEFYGYNREEVLSMGVEDIKENWRTYRKIYERELNRNV